MEDFKVRKEGVKKMTGVMEQIMKQGIASRNTEITENMVRLSFSTEQITQVTGLSASEVSEITKSIKN